jgi:acyl carrier protein
VDTWTPAEVRTRVAQIIAESLGIDPSGVTDQASLVRHLGAESIDFLDISFKCQQSFDVELPARLIQDRLIEWRSLAVLARTLRDRYGLSVSADDLRTVAPSTVSAILAHLADKHGLARDGGDEERLAVALAEQLVHEMAGMGLDLSDLKPADLAGHLLDNVHSPAAVDQVLDRFTVGALAGYVADRLAEAGRLAAAG